MSLASTPEQQDFAALYRQYAPELLRRARAMLGDRDLSEDAVQDAFLKTWLYLESGGKIRRVRAFLHRVLSNVIIDVYRRRKSVSLDLLLEQGSVPSVDDTDVLVNMLDGKAALALIEHLPGAYRDVLRMRYAGNLSLGEIARASGQSKNTLGVRMHRGLAKLRHLYNPAYSPSYSTHE